MEQIPDPEFSTDAGIVTFNTRGRITSFSRGAEKITGWPRELALWQPLDTIFHLSDKTASFFDGHMCAIGE